MNVPDWINSVHELFPRLTIEPAAAALLDLGVITSLANETAVAGG